VSLRVVSSQPGETTGGRRILVSGAPPSPGPLPKEYARHLEHGEVLVWWDEKTRMQLGPFVLVLVVAIAILGFATVFAPEFWVQPWSALWRPVAVLLSPALLVLVRERANRRAVLVTDTAILDVDPDGTAHRLPWGAAVAVRRDLLRGGLVLHGRRSQVRVPPTLVDDARRAVATQARNMVGGSAPVDDPTGWLP
jgi:hypothetical protein